MRNPSSPTGDLSLLMNELTHEFLHHFWNDPLHSFLNHHPLWRLSHTLPSIHLWSKSLNDWISMTIEFISVGQIVMYEQLANHQYSTNRAQSDLITTSRAKRYDTPQESRACTPTATQSTSGPKLGRVTHNNSFFYFFFFPRPNMPPFTTLRVSYTLG